MEEAWSEGIQMGEILGKATEALGRFRSITASTLVAVRKAAVFLKTYTAVLYLIILSIAL